MWYIGTSYTFIIESLSGKYDDAVLVPLHGCFPSHMIPAKLREKIFTGGNLILFGIQFSTMEIQGFKKPCISNLKTKVAQINSKTPQQHTV